MTFRICITCTPPHVDNCPHCFGFGFLENGSLISAGDAGDDWPEDKPYTPCPTCKGTPYNNHLIILYGDKNADEPQGILYGKDLIESE